MVEGKGGMRMRKERGSKDWEGGMAALGGYCRTKEGGGYIGLNQLQYCIVGLLDLTN